METYDAVERPLHKKSAAVSVCGVSFIVCVLVGLFAQTAWPIAVAIPCWLVAYCIDTRNKRTYRNELEQYRDLNASLHPEVFERDPPSDLDAVTGDYVDLYDCITLTRLGIVEKSDIIAILRTYADTPDLMPKGSNDIPFCHTDLTYFRDCQPNALSSLFTDLLDPIIDADNLVDLTLRWVEPRTGE